MNRYRRIDTVSLNVAHLQHLNALFAQNPEAVWVNLKGYDSDGEYSKTTATLVVPDKAAKAKKSKDVTRTLEEITLFDAME